MYFPRTIDAQLSVWSRETGRKPLLIRGARQVGKSSAVRALSKEFDHFLEVNFEEQRRVHSLFDDDLDPFTIVEGLSALYRIPVIPGKTLLFFDEIQACIPAISSLRFFYEKYPELHVVAAGSLLEFAMDEIPSFGVGRIRTAFMYPMSFDEYLVAAGEERLLYLRQEASPQRPLPDALHQKLLGHLRRFLITGGMPEVVASYLDDQDVNRCGRVLDDLIITLQSDFAKYRQRVPAIRLSVVFDAIVRQAGGKFVYAKVATEANHLQIKKAVELLVMAGLVIPVTHTSANGLPLGAEINPRKRKFILLDTGIAQRLMGLDISDLLLETSLEVINKGAIVEQFAGLELLKSSSCWHREHLYYWHREAKSSNAEVDYLVIRGGLIIPVEVKSGTRGAMQSLMRFLAERRAPYGIRLSLENYSTYEAIQSYPVYAAADVRHKVD
jgi:uncharacterized protein